MIEKPWDNKVPLFVRIKDTDIELLHKMEEELHQHKSTIITWALRHMYNTKENGLWLQRPKIG
jgi:hypothetical protein